MPDADGYTRPAVDAITKAARGEPDFGGWLAEVLCAAAARLGSSAAPGTVRPGSWEAALVRQILAGTVGEDDEYLGDYREAPDG